MLCVLTYVFMTYIVKEVDSIAAPSKSWVCGRTFAEIMGSNRVGGMDVCLFCCALSGTRPCDGLSTPP